MLSSSELTSRGPEIASSGNIFSLSIGYRHSRSSCHHCAESFDRLLRGVQEASASERSSHSTKTFHFPVLTSLACKRISNIVRILLVSLEDWSTTGPLPVLSRLGPRLLRFLPLEEMLGRYSTSILRCFRFLMSAFLGRPRLGGGNSSLISEFARVRSNSGKCSRSIGVNFSNSKFRKV